MLTEIDKGWTLRDPGPDDRPSVALHQDFCDSLLINGQDPCSVSDDILNTPGCAHLLPQVVRVKPHVQNSVIVDFEVELSGTAVADMLGVEITGSRLRSLSMDRLTAYCLNVLTIAEKTREPLLYRGTGLFSDGRIFTAEASIVRREQGTGHHFLIFWTPVYDSKPSRPLLPSIPLVRIDLSLTAFGGVGAFDRPVWTIEQCNEIIF